MKNRCNTSRKPFTNEASKERLKRLATMRMIQRKCRLNESEEHHHQRLSKIGIQYNIGR